MGRMQPASACQLETAGTQLLITHLRMAPSKLNPLPSKMHFEGSTQKPMLMPMSQEAEQSFHIAAFMQADSLAGSPHCSVRRHVVCIIDIQPIRSPLPTQILWGFQDGLCIAP